MKKQTNIKQSNMNAFGTLSAVVLFIVMPIDFVHNIDGLLLLWFYGLLFLWLIPFAIALRDAQYIATNISASILSMHSFITIFETISFEYQPYTLTISFIAAFIVALNREAIQTKLETDEIPCN